MSVLVAAVSVSRGVSSIEPMNTIVVPTLLLIILFSFYWGLFLPYAYIGIKYFFTPNWSKLVTLPVFIIIMNMLKVLLVILRCGWMLSHRMHGTLVSYYCLIRTIHTMHTHRSCTGSVLDILYVHDKEKWSCTYWDVDSIVQ